MKKNNKPILVTGCSGFIGYHLCCKLLKSKHTVIGLDFNNYINDKTFYKKRLTNLKKYKNFKFLKLNISNYKKLNNIFSKKKFDTVIHLAAQAGVRMSYDRPDIYFNSNIIGFFNLIDLSKKNNIKHFIYASSSSVYGDSKRSINLESDNTDRPESFYAASKKCNEIMAYSYSSMHGLRTTGLRFFTVYGPYGRSDMSPIIFTDSILKNKKIKIHNYGNHFRDFTYIDDVVDIIYKLLKNKSSSKIPYEIFNIGSGKSTKLNKFISLIEYYLKIKSKKTFVKHQKGDVYKTQANIKKIKKIINIRSTPLKIGLEKLVNWYKDIT